MNEYTLFGAIFLLFIGGLFGYFYGKITTEKKFKGLK
jgi:hypothetical protein